MLTNRATGIASIRLTRAGSSSRSPRSTPLADRIRPYTLSQRLPPPSRYDAHTSSGAVEGRGGTTGLLPPVYAVRGEWEWENVAGMRWKW